MARGRASTPQRKSPLLGLQLYGLLSKTWSLQKRSKVTNVCQVAVPLVLLAIMTLMQVVVNLVIGGQDISSITIPANPQPEPLLYTNTSYNFHHYGVANEGTGWSAGEIGGRRIGADCFLDPDLGSGLMGLMYPGVDDTFGGLVGTCTDPPTSKAAMQEAILDKWFDGIVLQEATEDSDQLSINYYSGAYEFNELKFPDGADASLRVRASLYHNLTGNFVAGLASSATGTLIRMQSSLATAVLRNATNSNQQIRAGVASFPTAEQTFSLNIVSFVQILFLPLIYHLTLPVLMAAIVYDKEERMLDIMGAMGLRTPVYWLSQYIFGMIVFMLQYILTVVFGVIPEPVGFRFFQINSFGLLLLIGFVWSNVVVSMAFLLSAFFQRTRPAQTIGYFLTIVVVLVAFVGEGEIQNESQAVKDNVTLLPSWAFQRIVNILSANSDVGAGGVTFENYVELGVGKLLNTLLVESIFLFILAFYFERIVGRNGVREHPLFFLQPLLAKMRGGEVQPMRREQDPEKLAESGANPGDAPDVIAERNAAVHNKDSLVRVLGIRKTYPGVGGQPPKNAVNGVTLRMKDGEVFGLLGPNGAGKTSLIQILSGSHSATAGTARIAGLDVANDLRELHQITGICPQHDVLWGRLTAREHLMLYGRLKSVTGEALVAQVDKLLRQVGLYEERNDLVGGFSGGMKRRLSVAMSVMGNPTVVFLDEPTTGLDPKMRQNVWEIINEIRKGKVLILTTHSMEEAETLCDRLCIMAAGRVYTVGEPAELKQRFGKGYHLTVTSLPQHGAALHQYVMKLFPGAELENALAGVRHYQVPREQVTLSAVFEEIEANKEKQNIIDWGMSQTTLEEVFLKISRDALAGDVTQ